MKRFLEILANVRAACGEIEQTFRVLLMALVGIYGAWELFIRLLK